MDKKILNVQLNSSLLSRIELNTKVLFPRVKKAGVKANSTQTNSDQVGLKATMLDIALR